MALDRLSAAAAGEIRSADRAPRREAHRSARHGFIGFTFPIATVAEAGHGRVLGSFPDGHTGERALATAVDVEVLDHDAPRLLIGPHLERDAIKPDVLGQILAARAKN